MYTSGRGRGKLWHKPFSMFFCLIYLEYTCMLKRVQPFWIVCIILWNDMQHREQYTSWRVLETLGWWCFCLSAWKILHFSYEASLPKNYPLWFGPTSIIEAMACGCFTVFSKTGLSLAPRLMLFELEITQIKYKPYFRPTYSTVLK